MHSNYSASRIVSILFTALVALILTACGGGGGGGSSAPATQSIGGGGVKGPLANAIVTAYAFDGSAAGFKGAVVDTATTGADAKIVGLNVPMAPPYILEFTSNSGTTDITTGVAPVITTMRTVLTQALIDTGEDVYATPLTTMATDLAVANADSNVAPFMGDNDGTTTSAEFVAALPVAASQVTSTLGFGIDSSIDIFDTPPLVDNTTDTTAEQTAVAAYRAAVEAVTAVVYEMDQQSSGTTPDEVLAEMAADLADGDIDGSIGGTGSSVYAAATLAVLDQDPATLPIPNDPLNQTVGDIEAILVAETATTGTGTTTTDLSGGTINTVPAPAQTNPDIDGDGVANADDAYPNDATADTDTDNDGAPDVAYTDATRATMDTARSDTDDDNDGWLDTEDDFPTDATAFLDPVLDRDGDTVANGTDPCPLDATDACVGITDTDSDGVADGSDNCPSNSNPSQLDTDGDMTGDVCDTNDDGDAALDVNDAFPLDNTETTDTDGDGIGDNADTDDDNDGVSDTQEGIDGTNPLLPDTDGDGYFDGSDAFPNDSTEYVDTDNDGTGNTLDTDDDGDGLSDVDEATAGTKPLVADTDGDTLQDGAEVAAGTSPLLADTDADGSNDNADNCPLAANTDQLNTDGDAMGNVCDADDDNDNLTDTAEIAAGTDPLLADTDGDGTNDDVDAFPLDVLETTDTDSDTIGDNADNCPAMANTDQLNTDGDAMGNVCDADDDNDTILDGVDNCPVTANTDQLDSDGNGIGNVCDFDADGDGWSDTLDNCPAIANASQLNTDGDAMGNACDSDDDNDNLSDTAEAALGTNPLLADTDGDGTNDDVDVFPLDSGEIADTDSDTVGDNADNCPTIANTDQLNTDGDAMGNVCDSDDDNDGLSDTAEAAAGTNPLLADTDGDGSNDSVDAFPLDATEQLDSDGDGVGDNADVCPNDPSTSIDPAVCAGVNMTGIYKLTTTVTGISPVNGGTCSGDEAVGDVDIIYGTFSQTAANITMTTAYGDVLTGTMSDSTTGAYSVTGTTTRTNPFISATTGNSITVTGTETTGTALAALTDRVNGTAQCLTNYDVVTSKVYTHVAGEDYDGVYGLELLSDEGRNTFAVQFEITGSTMAIYIPGNNPNETITNTSFDPNSGFFSFDINGVEDYSDGMGGTGSNEWQDKMTGILLRAPNDASGAPIVAINIDGYSGDYDAAGGSAGGGTLQSIDTSSENGYGKRVSSTGFTRSSFYRNGATGNKVEGIFMGMSHPPLKPATAASDMYVEVLDGATRLCTGLYSKRYTNASYLPAADMATEAFQSQFYSFVNCDTSGGTGTPMVTDAMNYTVRIMDTGPDGVIDGGDDTAVAGASMTVTADVNTAFFTETVNVHDFALNGAKPSQTMKRGAMDGVIQLFGFYDVTQPMTFSWTGLSGAEQYALETKMVGEREVTRIPMMAAAGTGTESITLPAGTLNQRDSQLIRIRARKDDATTGARALSISNKWVMLNPGVQGLFNVELGGAMGAAHDTFQVWVDANITGTNMSGDVTGNINGCYVANNPAWTCGASFGGYGTINYTTKVLTLFLRDATGVVTTADVGMSILFSDSANATVTGTTSLSTGFALTGVTIVPAQTHVRLANPELIVRSMQPSGSVPMQSVVVLANTIGGGALTSGAKFDKAVFKRDDNGSLVTGVNSNNGITSKLSWDDAIGTNTKPFAGVVGAFQERPTTDGVAQKAGHFLADRTNSDWGLGAGLLDDNFGGGVKYKSVWLNTTDATQKWVFKTTYMAPDASVLVTPVHNQVTVNLPTPVTAGTGVGEVATPIDVTTNPAFGLTWTGIVPAGGEWQIRVTYTAGAAAGADVRTAWMSAAHADLTDNGDGTWTWVNNPLIGLTSGDSAVVQIRARDGAAFTMLGVQRAGTTDDRVYLTMP